jgi:ankyrin repeat protein
LLLVFFYHNLEWFLLYFSRFFFPGASTKIKAEDGRDPLFSAVEKRNIEIVKILLEHGANPNSRYDGTYVDKSKLGVDYKESAV